MLALGVDAEARARVSAATSPSKACATDYDAVVLAIGAWKGRALRIPGEDHPAVLSGIDFLQDVNAGKPVTVGKRVAIIGGGNTALDAARCSLRCGASKVTMYYRRTREEMPASDAEIEEAWRRGSTSSTSPRRCPLQSEGRTLKSLTLLKMALGEPDASGRRQAGARGGLRVLRARGHRHLRGRPVLRHEAAWQACRASWTTRGT